MNWIDHFWQLAATVLGGIAVLAGGWMQRRYDRAKDKERILQENHASRERHLIECVCSLREMMVIAYEAEETSALIRGIEDDIENVYGLVRSPETKTAEELDRAVELATQRKFDLVDRNSENREHILSLYVKAMNLAEQYGEWPGGLVFNESVVQWMQGVIGSHEGIKFSRTVNLNPKCERVIAAIRYLASVELALSQNPSCQHHGIVEASEAKLTRALGP